MADKEEEGYELIKCRTCGNTGKLGKKDCRFCGGTGWKRVNK